MAYINITDTDLQKSATTYKKELLIMPVIAAEATLKHMTGRPGVAGRETVGQISGNIELGPYNATRVDSDGIAITPRTLETFLGSVVKKFDLNEAAKTVYGTIFAQGDALKNTDLAYQILAYLGAQLGQKLNMAIFAGERDASGTTTADLFDGFDTITADEITGGNIAANKGNYELLSAAITEQNAVDVLMGIYENADDNLQGTPSKMYMPFDVYRKYNKAYLSTFGAVAYNQQYKKTFLEGSDGLCELVPLASKKNSSYIHLSTQGNMLYGYGDGLANENLAVEKYHEFLLSYISTMYFGVQFESISKERLYVAQLAS